MRLLFLYLILTSSVFARIGETPNQLNNRYDKSFPAGEEAVFSEGRILKFGKVVVYQSDGWTITATFINNRCERIRYKKVGAWTDAQIYAVLKANSNGQTWTKSDPFNKHQKQWIGVGSSSAFWQSFSNMDMKTDAYYVATERLKKGLFSKIYG